MGSESLKKIGMNRGVDTTRTDPRNLFIVGLDGIGETEQDKIDWLCVLFPSLRDKILAERDPRSVMPIPEWFLTDFNPADADPVKYENMGVVFPDDCGEWSGKPLLVLNDGRQRTKTFRAWSADRPEDDALEILCLQKRYKTPLDAAKGKARGNARIEQTPTHRAWLAHEFKEAGMALDKIAPLVNVGTEQGLTNLLALLDCSPAVQAAVDAGPDACGVTQSAALDMLRKSKGDHASMDLELAKRLGAAAGKTGRARSSAIRGESDGKPKPVSPKVIRRAVEHLTTADRTEMKEPTQIDGYVAIIRHMQGDESAYDALPDDVRRAFIAAGKVKSEKVKKTRAVKAVANEQKEAA